MRVVAALGAALVTGLLVPIPATAGEGSLVSGVVWADTNRDGVHDADEVAQEGVTVELLSSPGGAVVATTTTDGDGNYSFADAADGDYTVRVTAPGAFEFPDAAGGDNDFASTGPPLPGEPEQGASATISVDGDSQHTDIDAGMQPVADLVIEPIPIADGCAGLASTGTEPFDAADGGGQDSTTANCLVRTDDDTTQQYSVSLTGLPTGASVANVVADFTISSEDAARFRFNGPLAGGLPTGCLSAGVDPPSSIVTNPDGSVTLHCNMGTFTSSVKPITVPVRALNTSPDGSHFHLTAEVHAAAGDAGPSNTLTGPDIEITAAPQWDLLKSNYRSTGQVTTATINGVQQTGYIFNYRITLRSLATKGTTQLESPLDFFDKFSFPTAVILRCRRATSGSDGFQSQGMITCPPPGTAQGPDGFPMTIDTLGASASAYQYIVQVFVPLEDAYRAVDPDWQEGDPIPTGEVPTDNRLTDTEGWAAPDGSMNNGDGFEPGWDGQDATGNNFVENPPMQVAPPAPGIPGSGKTYFSLLGGCCAPEANAGQQTGARVDLNTDAQTTITNPVLCDVFDVSVWRLDTVANPPAGYVIEYAEGPNSNDLQTGPIDPNTQRYPFDTTAQQQAADGCATDPGPWSTDPETFGAGWQDTVNMVRMRPIDPATTLGPSSRLRLNLVMTARSTYNGGPNAGQTIPEGVMFPNDGGWTDPTTADGWSTTERVLRFRPMLMSLSKTEPVNEYLPGSAVEWTITPRVAAGETDGTIHQVVVSDTLPAEVELDLACTEDGLPAGATVSYNPATREVTWNLGDQPIGASLPSPLPVLTLCVVVSPLTPPGTTVRNTARASSPDASNAPTASDSIVINGTGELAIQKSVDHPLVKPGQEFTWSVQWGNTSADLSFLPPDVIDVLPWNGDGGSGSLSPRDQFESDFTGSNQLTGPLAQPDYTPGSTQTGAVPGTWYYATADPSTISDDPRAVTNVAPEAPAGTWLTEAEIAAGAGFGAVTAVRFVSSDPLEAGSQVQAEITETADPAVSNGQPTLHGVYVNRAQIFSATFPQQPLRSNEPFVLMPGFSVGDLVFADNDGTGLFNGDNGPLADIPIEIVGDNGDVVGTTTTNAEGRWVLESLSEGTYTVRIPASAFQPGGPLEKYRVDTVGSNEDAALGETLANKNTATADPATTGLVSSPITFAFTEDDDGYPTGGNQPDSGANDPTGISNPRIPAGFKNLNMDLAVTPEPDVDIEKSTNTVDADEAPGPLVTVGDPVVWTYVVTNTGRTRLSDVTVTDDQIDAADIDCGDGTNVVAGPLPPGESFTCTATGVAVEGQYENTGTVSATNPNRPNEPEVTDEDPSHHEGVDPAVDIEKSTNTVDADEAPGPLIAVGDPVVWSYVVTNTGNAELTNVTVTDDQIDASDIDCGDGTNVVAGPLAPDDSFTCTATGVAAAGEYENTGTVVGDGPETTDENGDPVPPQQVDDEDPSHHTGVNPAVDIEKSTNTVDADEAPGPLVLVGDPVVWSYVVTNTGDTELTNVTVTDDQLDAGDIDCGEGTNVVAGPLAPDESFTCTAQGVAAAGQYENTAMVVGVGPETTDENGESAPREVSDDDPSHHFGAAPSIDIEKSTNGEDADQGPGPSLAVGDPVTWTYVVTNTGNVELTNVTVTDDQIDASEIDCGDGSNVVAGPLAPDGTFTCTAQGVAAEGEYENTGSVVGDAPETVDENGDPVPPQELSDDDPSHYNAATLDGDGELVSTGRSIVGPLTAGLIVLLAGVLLLLRVSRRRAKYAI